MPLVTRQNQVIYYNGYANFGPYTKCESLDCKPEKDISGRTTVANRYTMRLRTIVTGPTAKVESDRMRKALSKNGGTLIVTGLASGDIRVNDGAKRDISYGPWVDVLSFDPSYGGELATAMTWSVSWLVPDSDSAKYGFKISEFTYTCSYISDQAGYTTRTIDLRFRIPQNVSQDGQGRMLDNPELYALSVLPPEIPGFRRKFGTRTISEDRSEVRWQITDEQLPGQSPFPGVVEERGSYSMSSDNTMGVMWNGTITYECELPPNGSLNTAIDAMSTFVNSRTDLLRRLKDRNGGNAAMVPVSFSFSEPECFGRKKFTFSLTFTVTTTLRQLLLRSGMWTEAPGRNWQKWSSSLHDTALNPLGYYELQMDVGQDRIVSLSSNNPAKVFTQGYRVRPQNQDGVLFPQFPPTNPLNSWRVFKNATYLEQESAVVSTRTLPSVALNSGDSRDGFMVANGNGTSTGGGVGQFADVKGGSVAPGSLEGLLRSKLPEILRQRGGQLQPEYPPQGSNSATAVARPQQWVIMVGEAVRIGWEIPQPKLEKVNGVPVLLSNRPDLGEGFKMWADFGNGIQPFYKAKWKLRYAINGDLPNIPLPPAPNPLLAPG